MVNMSELETESAKSAEPANKMLLNGLIQSIGPQPVDSVEKKMENLFNNEHKSKIKFSQNNEALDVIVNNTPMYSYSSQVLDDLRDENSQSSSGNNCLDGFKETDNFLMSLDLETSFDEFFSSSLKLDMADTKKDDKKFVENNDNRCLEKSDSKCSIISNNVSLEKTDGVCPEKTDNMRLETEDKCSKIEEEKARNKCSKIEEEKAGNKCQETNTRFDIKCSKKSGKHSEGLMKNKIASVSSDVSKIVSSVSNVKSKPQIKKKMKSLCKNVLPAKDSTIINYCNSVPTSPVDLFETGKMFTCPKFKNSSDNSSLTTSSLGMDLKALGEVSTTQTGMTNISVKTDKTNYKRSSILNKDLKNRNNSYLVTDMGAKDFISEFGSKPREIYSNIPLEANNKISRASVKLVPYNNRNNNSFVGGTDINKKSLAHEKRSHFPQPNNSTHSSKTLCDANNKVKRELENKNDIDYYSSVLEERRFFPKINKDVSFRQTLGSLNRTSNGSYKDSGSKQRNSDFMNDADADKIDKLAVYNCALDDAELSLMITNIIGATDEAENEDWFGKSGKKSSQIDSTTIGNKFKDNFRGVNYADYEDDTDNNITNTLFDDSQTSRKNQQIENDGESIDDQFPNDEEFLISELEFNDEPLIIDSQHGNNKNPPSTCASIKIEPNDSENEEKIRRLVWPPNVLTKLNNIMRKVSPNRSVKDRNNQSNIGNKQPLQDSNDCISFDSLALAYLCFLCNMNFNSEQELLQHLECHNDSRYFHHSNLKDTSVKMYKKSHKGYRCKYCSKVFSALTILEKHLPIHRNAKYLTCNICDKTFKVAAFKAHVKMHLNPDIYTCKQCGIETLSEKGLLAHQKECQYDKSEDFVRNPSAQRHKSEQHLYRINRLAKGYAYISDARKKPHNDTIELSDDDDTEGLDTFSDIRRRRILSAQQSLRNKYGTISDCKMRKNLLESKCYKSPLSSNYMKNNDSFSDDQDELQNRQHDPNITLKKMREKYKEEVRKNKSKYKVPITFYKNHKQHVVYASKLDIENVICDDNANNDDGNNQTSEIDETNQYSTNTEVKYSVDREKNPRDSANSVDVKCSIDRDNCPYDSTNTNAKCSLNKEKHPFRGEENRPVKRLKSWADIFNIDGKVAKEESSFNSAISNKTNIPKQDSIHNFISGDGEHKKTNNIAGIRYPKIDKMDKKNNQIFVGGIKRKSFPSVNSEVRTKLPHIGAIPNKKSGIYKADLSSIVCKKLEILGRIAQRSSLKPFEQLGINLGWPASKVAESIRTYGNITYAMKNGVLRVKKNNVRLSEFGSGKPFVQRYGEHDSKGLTSQIMRRKDLEQYFLKQDRIEKALNSVPKSVTAKKLNHNENRNGITSFMAQNKTEMQNRNKTRILEEKNIRHNAPIIQGRNVCSTQREERVLLTKQEVGAILGHSMPPILLQEGVVEHQSEPAIQPIGCDQTVQLTDNPSAVGEAFNMNLDNIKNFKDTATDSYMSRICHLFDEAAKRRSQNGNEPARENQIVSIQNQLQASDEDISLLWKNHLFNQNSDYQLSEENDRTQTTFSALAGGKPSEVESTSSIPTAIGDLASSVPVPTFLSEHESAVVQSTADINTRQLVLPNREPSLNYADINVESSTGNLCPDIISAASAYSNHISPLNSTNSEISEPVIAQYGTELPPEFQLEVSNSLQNGQFGISYYAQDPEMNDDAALLNISSLEEDMSQESNLITYIQDSSFIQQDEKANTAANGEQIFMSTDVTDETQNLIGSIISDNEQQMYVIADGEDSHFSDDVNFMVDSSTNDNEADSKPDQTIYIHHNSEEIDSEKAPYEISIDDTGIHITVNASVVPPVHEIMEIVNHSMQQIQDAQLQNVTEENNEEMTTYILDNNQYETATNESTNNFIIPADSTVYYSNGQIEDEESVVSIQDTNRYNEPFLTNVELEDTVPV